MIEDYNPIEEISSKAQDFSPKDYCSEIPEPTTRDFFCDCEEFETHTALAVKDFFEWDVQREPPYAEADIEQRAEYIKEFHDGFALMSGYSDNLCFSEMEPNNCGAFDSDSKQIDLNTELLHSYNPKDAMITIMHESRHAFQDFAIEHPDMVDVDPAKIKEWEDNFKNYIRPELDIEAYNKQPVEVDAEDFANRMYNIGASYAA